MSEFQFDVVIIGGGPGGYIAAIKAAQLGLRTACIDKRSTFGGTCLNVGCIPSKALLYSSEKYAFTKEHLADHGIVTSGIKLDLKKMLARKNSVVDDLTKGIAFLFKKNKVTSFNGLGKITGANEVEITDGKNQKDKITTKSIIIATGSEAISIPGIDIDEKQIVSSTGALDIPKVPKSMHVIGGGYIGLELGSVWARLGADVTVVEFADSLVPAMDKEICKQLQKLLTKQGLKFKLSTKVVEAKKSKAGVTLSLESADGKSKEKIKTDIVLLSIGRRPYTEGLGLEKLGVKKDNRGCVVTNEHYQTSVPNIFAIGDAITGPMLAHKAEEEGVAVAEILAGQAGHVNYRVIPGVVYTSPEVATVGKTEEELKADGVAYNVGKFPFAANSRARSVGESEGMVKILAEKASDKVLGVHIIGPDAGTMIAEVVLAMEYDASSEDIARTCHAHPTFNEAIKEAALATHGKALHI
jgi:dihydrolipoyl dehydrogenase